jgi:hypothetical protein
MLLPDQNIAHLPVAQLLRPEKAPNRKENVLVRSRIGDGQKIVKFSGVYLSKPSLILPRGTVPPHMVASLRNHTHIARGSGESPTDRGEGV